MPRSSSGGGRGGGWAQLELTDPSRAAILVSRLPRVQALGFAQARLGTF